MSYRVFGFVLRNRKWGKLTSFLVMALQRLTWKAKLDISHLSPVGSKGTSDDDDDDAAADKMDKRETPFDQLVLPPGHKNMVLSLVAQHFRDRENITMDNDSADIVRGKGLYLIFIPSSTIKTNVIYRERSHHPAPWRAWSWKNNYCW
jgi:hypothetical protein